MARTNAYREWLKQDLGALIDALELPDLNKRFLRSRWLEKQRRVRWVRYPFLPSHPQSKLARRQMSGGSGIITIELAGNARAFCRKLKLFTLAESLGGVESLVCHPATMTHASVPRAVRKRVGITDGVVRFSVGIEDVADLIADVKQALGAK